MNEITTREMIKQTMDALGGKANKDQILEKLSEKYPDAKKQTISAHLYTLSVNYPGRIGGSRNNQTRSLNPKYDFLYRIRTNEFELYDPVKHGNYGLIDFKGKTVVAKDGIPISPETVNISPLLQFLKYNMNMQDNYQPIVIKTLLETAPEFSSSIQNIQTQIQLLNFNRKPILDDTISSITSSLDGFITFDDESVSLDFKQFSLDDVPECLKICGQKIAKWHVDKIVEKEYDLWHIMPGSNDENFPYLDEFLKTSSMGIGWDKIRNISNLSEVELKEKFIELYENDNAFQGFLDFTKIKQKDIVVLIKAQQEITDFGIVVGDYEFKDVVKPSYPHRKQVVWLNQGPILPEELPNPTLAEFMATCGKLVKRKQELISVLLGKNTMNTIPEPVCFILTQNPYSKYDDIEGKQYQYDSYKPGYRRLLEGSKFVIQSNIDDIHYFIGHGKIETITQSPDTNEKGEPIIKFVAKYLKYTKFDPSKLRTPEIFEEMKSMDTYVSSIPSIFRISDQLFAKIIGQDFVEDVVNMDKKYTRMMDVLRHKKNIILYGPPGTGKTYTANKIAKQIINEDELTWRSLAALILLENYPLSLNSNKIADKISSRGLKITLGTIPHETIARDIQNDIEVKGEKSLFKKTDAGAYGLIDSPTYLLAAEIVLTAYPEPKTSEEITDIVLKKDLLKDKMGKTPSRTMSREFGRDMVKGANSILIQMGSHYRLRNQNIQNDVGKFIKNVTFHQSYGYEEFMEGIKPKTVNNGIVYEIEDGVFKQFCINASKDNSENKYVIVIDEINRGNISKIFGELITILEKDKRGKSITLSYSKENFSVPKNMYIIGTMNTADQSLTHMDAALKRRFGLVEIMPNPSLLKTTKAGIQLSKILEKINERIISHSSRDNQIGHSYFMDDGESLDSINELQLVFATDIIPLLRDYFYDDEESLKEILGGQFIDWDNPHRDMKQNWQETPSIFLQTLRDAFGVNIVSN